MKKLLVIILSLTLGGAANAALPQPDLLAQIHFAGAQKISADANAAAFTNEFCSAEALALRAQTAGKLSVWLAGWLQKNTGVNVADGPAKLRPLLDDLQQAEWFLEARMAANGKPEVALAVHLADGQAQLWRANLQPFLPGATFKNAGGWLVIDDGPAAPQLGDRLAQKISVPPVGWLAVDLNWSRLAQWWPQVKTFDLPETQFTVTAADANLHFDGKLLFPENLSLALEPWRVPTNSLRQPFVSLTAVRGFASWWQQRPWAQAYQISPVPNQLFVWGLPQVPYQTFAALPVPSASNALQQAYARLKPQFEPGATNPFLMPLTLTLTNREADLQGAPFVAPFLEAKTERAGQFLLAGAFPNTPGFAPLPAELLNRLADKNLVFYHWEITAERMPQVLHLAQLSLMLTSRKQLDAESAAGKWVNLITPKFGNTVTEIKQTGPAEMSFTRQAPGGLTAFEFFALASWLEANNFPGFDLKQPTRGPRMKHPQPKPPGALPAPAPAH